MLSYSECRFAIWQNILQKKENIKFELCLVCQTNSEEELIKKPSSHENLLKSIQARAQYGDAKSFEIWSTLKEFETKDLIENGSWHRSCYQEISHSGMLKRLKEKYERELSGPSSKRSKQCQNAQVTHLIPLTRSKTAPYNSDLCFFCDGMETLRQPLHKARTETAGHALDTAIRKQQNEKLLVKLSTAVDTKDAHAIDIRYHKKCWATHVTNILRKPDNETDISQEHTSVIAAKLEFVTMAESALKRGKIITMSDLQSAYDSICQENNVKTNKENRKTLKELLKSEIDEIEFHRPKKMNESERVSVKKARDIAIQQSEDAEDDCKSDMKTLYDAAVQLRKSINKSKRWSFGGSFDTLTSENCPEELYCFFRWIIQGPNSTLSAEEKSVEVHCRALHLSQSTMSMCLTERQVNNKKSTVIHSTREMPEQLAIGIAIHQAIRNKEIINLLHGFGLSVEYNRLLRVETEIERNVIKQIQKDNGLYIPPDIVKGRHIFFAVDNSDFQEDTHDGKRNLHGAAMTIYQQTKADDDVPSLR